MKNKNELFSQPYITYKNFNYLILLDMVILDSLSLLICLPSSCTVLHIYFFSAWKFKNILQIHMKWVTEVSQSRPTLCDPLDYSLPGSSIHGIFQARGLEWVVLSFSRRSSQPRDWTWVTLIVGRHFTVWAIREANSHTWQK